MAPPYDAQRVKTRAIWSSFVKAAAQCLVPDATVVTPTVVARAADREGVVPVNHDGNAPVHAIWLASFSNSRATNMPNQRLTGSPDWSVSTAAG